MNSRNRSIILVNTKVPCPLCKEGFMNKPNMRIHLTNEHTNKEAEIFIDKIMCKGKICKM